MVRNRRHLLHTKSVSRMDKCVCDKQLLEALKSVLVLVPQLRLRRVFVACAQIEDGCAGVFRACLVSSSSSFCVCLRSQRGKMIEFITHTRFVVCTYVCNTFIAVVVVVVNFYCRCANCYSTPATWSTYSSISLPPLAPPSSS